MSGWFNCMDSQFTCYLMPTLWIHKSTQYTFYVLKPAVYYIGYLFISDWIINRSNLSKNVQQIEKVKLVS